MAQLSMSEAAGRVDVLVRSKVNLGHQLNLMESNTFFHKNVTMNNFVVAFYEWLPFTIECILSVPDAFTASVLAWPPNQAMAVSPLAPFLYTLDFNKTICNDTVHFPGSNCSVFGQESYPLDSNYKPIWNSPIFINVPSHQTDMPFWKTGVMSRSVGWRSSANNRFNPGYTIIFPTPTLPTY
eukprot:RCo007611